ncbi:MAG: hypothetical protein ABIK96_05600 [bacterium]
MIDLQKLNDHSREFAHRLFRKYPDWIRHARFDPYEDFEKEALLVEVPRPVDGSRHGLFITTSEWEVSVGYGESFHTRFGISGDGDGGDFYAEALDFIADFVEERVAVATASDDREWLGAWLVDLREESLEDIAVEEGESVKVRSWQGTYDREIRGPAGQSARDEA